MGSVPIRHYMLTLMQICSHASAYTQPQNFAQIISAVYCDHPFPYYKIYSKIYDIPIVNGFTPWIDYCCFYSQKYSPYNFSYTNDH